MVSRVVQFRFTLSFNTTSIRDLLCSVLGSHPKETWLISRRFENDNFFQPAQHSPTRIIAVTHQGYFGDYGNDQLTYWEAIQHEFPGSFWMCSWENREPLVIHHTDDNQQTELSFPCTHFGKLLCRQTLQLHMWLVPLRHKDLSCMWTSAYINPETHQEMIRSTKFSQMQSSTPTYLQVELAHHMILLCYSRKIVHYSIGVPDKHGKSKTLSRWFQFLTE